MKPWDELRKSLGPNTVQAGDDGGCFLIGKLLIVASFGGGWDHVSVSTTTACPTWSEMDQMRRLFFKPEEAVIQIHPPTAMHVSFHPYCLHLWRPHEVPIPLPPTWMIAPASMSYPSSPKELLP